MATRSATSGRTGAALFPEGVSIFVRQRSIELAGVMLMVAGLALAIALASYTPADPSLSHATSARVLNLMGYPGAVMADLLLQTVGLGGVLIALMFGGWGWRLLRAHHLPLWWLRIALMPAMVLLAAMAVSILPPPATWPRPLDVSLGGVVGQLFLGGVTHLSARYGLGAEIVAILAAALAAAGLLFAVAITRGEWQAMGRGAASGLRQSWTGLLWLAALRAKFGNPARQRAQTREAARRERLEPSLDGEAIPEPEPQVERARPAPAELVVARPTEAAPKKPAKKQASLDLPTRGGYQLPNLEALTLPKGTGAAKVDEEALAQNARLLESVLDDFGVKGQIVKVRPGPVVTLYELEPAPGTKTSRVIGLSDDIARSMSAVSVRVAVVPGRNVIGIELPNIQRETVYLRELLASRAPEQSGQLLSLALGKDIGGAPIIVDLARMPHLLIAGTTGSGKSVAINTMILSLLYRLSPDECRFIMVDPKMLELSVYDGIPHLLAPVVTDPKKAVVALKWAVKEMENRYRAMSKLGVRNLEGYNARVEEITKKGEQTTRKVQTGFDEQTGEPIFEEQALDLQSFPYIVVIVDEMADLMLVAGKEIEAAIQRLAQMARAAGIHIIMATQRPSVDVITGTIKANFPTRISFHVTSRIDSRTILSETGAEQLLGQGDMLYMAQGGRVTRVHGPFVSDTEVEAVVGYLKQQGEPTYVEDVTRDDEDTTISLGEDGNGSGDDLYDQAVALVSRERKASTSFVQRHLQIGYNRAARLIERMEKEGVVSTANHVGKREVLARDIDRLE